MCGQGAEQRQDTFLLALLKRQDKGQRQGKRVFSLKIAVTLCNLHTLWAKADPSDHSRWLLNRVNLPVNLIIFVAFVFACSSCGEDGVVIIILLECSLADNGVI